MGSNKVARAVELLRSEGLAPLVATAKGYARDESRRRWEGTRNRIAVEFNRIRYGSCYPSPYRLLYGDPGDVEYYLLESKQTDWSKRDEVDDDGTHRYEMDKGGFRRRKNVGRVVGGEWDRRRRAWENQPLFRSIRAVFAGDKTWTETEFVRNCLETIERSGSCYWYETKEAFLAERIPYVEELFERMKTEGYQTQSACPDDHRTEGLLHEVSVNIGRDGELLFNNRSGHHRLSMAKVLGIDLIPMIVIVRHERWQAIRREIHDADTPSELTARARTHLSHPDVQDLVTEGLVAEPAASRVE